MLPLEDVACIALLKGPCCDFQLNCNLLTSSLQLAQKMIPDCQLLVSQVKCQFQDCMI